MPILEAIAASKPVKVNRADVRTILIAEDQEDAREMMRIFLEGEGYGVVEAGNGRDAIRLAKETKPDLILMDLNMPEMDGLSAVREMRGFESLRDVPVIANSASGRHGMELFRDIESLGDGYLEYIPKPFDFEDLSERVRFLIKAAPGRGGETTAR